MNLFILAVFPICCIGILHFPSLKLKKKRIKGPAHLEKGSGNKGPQIVKSKSADQPFVTRRLSTVEVEDSEELAKLFHTRRFFDKSPAVLLPTLEANETWYTRIDTKDVRFNAIGKLFIVPYVNITKTELMLPDGTTYVDRAFNFQNGIPKFHCTAFYVSPNLLATAAHCLHSAGVTPSANFAIIFRQQYDGSVPYSVSLAEKFERVVIEWIYAAAYDADHENKDLWKHARGFDFAFMRTNRPSHENATYTLVSPDDFIPHVKKQAKAKTVKTLDDKSPDRNVPALQWPTPTLAVGYAGEYAEYFEPVSVSCSLAQATDAIVQNDDGVKHALSKPRNIAEIMGNQLFCVGKRGHMGGGGSGGPWMLDESAIPEGVPDREAKLRWVVGIESWGFQRLFKDQPADPLDVRKFREAQAYAKTSVSAWWRASAIFLYEAAKKADARQSLEKAIKDVMREDPTANL